MHQDPEERSSDPIGDWIKTLLDKQKLRETSFIIDVKGSSLGRKHKARKRPMENKPQTVKKTVIE